MDSITARFHHRWRSWRRRPSDTIFDRWAVFLDISAKVGQTWLKLVDTAPRLVAFESWSKPLQRLSFSPGICQHRPSIGRFRPIWPQQGRHKYALVL